MAVETLCPLRAGNSAMLAFDTLKIGGSSPSIMLCIPVKVKKFPSMASFEELAGITKSVRMSGSLAVTTVIIRRKMRDLKMFVEAMVSNRGVLRT